MLMEVRRVLCEVGEIGRTGAKDRQGGGLL